MLGFKKRLDSEVFEQRRDALMATLPALETAAQTAAVASLNGDSPNAWAAAKANLDNARSQIEQLGFAIVKARSDEAAAAEAARTAEEKRLVEARKADDRANHKGAVTSLSTGERAMTRAFECIIEAAKHLDVAWNSFEAYHAKPFPPDAPIHHGISTDWVYKLAVAALQQALRDAEVPARPDEPPEVQLKRVVSAQKQYAKRVFIDGERQQTPVYVPSPAPYRPERRVAIRGTPGAAPRWRVDPATGEIRPPSAEEAAQDIAHGEVIGFRTIPASGISPEAKFRALSEDAIARLRQVPEGDLVAFGAALDEEYAAVLRAQAVAAQPAGNPVQGPATPAPVASDDGPREATAAAQATDDAPVGDEETPAAVAPETTDSVEY